MVDNMRYGAEGSAETRTRILIVDDNVALAMQVQSHLKRAGHDVHVEHKGKPALIYAADHQMDLVVLDLGFPDMSGYEICVELRRIYYPWKLPVVMLTGMSRPKDQLLGFSHGADAYLTKPVTTSELINTVDSMLTRERA